MGRTRPRSCARAVRLWLGGWWLRWLSKGSRQGSRFFFKCKRHNDMMHDGLSVVGGGAPPPTARASRAPHSSGPGAALCAARWPRWRCPRHLHCPSSCSLWVRELRPATYATCGRAALAAAWAWALGATPRAAWGHTQPIPISLNST
eukprot:scaffold4526_cov89-Isochrysis_galbana.AAC.4